MEPDDTTLPPAPTDDPETAPPEPATPPPIADLDGLTRDYGGHHALGPLTLTIERGCLGLLGPNGAGKSTLLRLMMGLIEPTSGTLRVLGEPVGPETRRRIGYVPEGDSRFPGLSGVQAVVYAGRLVGMSRADAIARAHQVLDYVGLGEARYRDASTYSTGMRQRLKIAQALVHGPDLLILDEPTEGVDPEAREDILALVHDLSREQGTQVILSTHLLHEVERVASHVLLLRAGNVVEHAPTTEMRTAAERGFELRVNGAIEPLLARLDEAGLQHEWVAPTLRVKAVDPQAILRHVEATGLVVRHLAPVEVSLNDVYASAIAPPKEER